MRQYSTRDPVYGLQQRANPKSQSQLLKATYPINEVRLKIMEALRIHLDVNDNPFQQTHSPLVNGSHMLLLPFNSCRQNVQLFNNF